MSESTRYELYTNRKRSINSRIVMIGYSGVLHRSEELANNLGVELSEFFDILAEVCADHYENTNAQHWFERGRYCSLRSYELRRPDQQ